MSKFKKFNCTYVVRNSFGETKEIFVEGKESTESNGYCYKIIEMDTNKRKLLSEQDLENIEIISTKNPGLLLD